MERAPDHCIIARVIWCALCVAGAAVAWPFERQRRARCLPWVAAIGLTLVLAANLTRLTAGVLLAEAPAEVPWLHEIETFPLSEAK